VKNENADYSAHRDGGSVDRHDRASGRRGHRAAAWRGRLPVVDLVVPIVVLVVPVVVLGALEPFFEFVLEPVILFPVVDRGAKLSQPVTGLRFGPPVFELCQTHDDAVGGSSPGFRRRFHAPRKCIGGGESGANGTLV
jgi:hypothetical protein